MHIIDVRRYSNTRINASDKLVLDNIIEKNKAQPVGDGYIDIIVLRDYYRNFIADLVKNGFRIESISWWEWCPNTKRSEYGAGGPPSNHYDGWFSELSIAIDEIHFKETLDKQDQIDEAVQMIEDKTIQFPSEIVSFRQNEWLTPAIWLEVPDHWINKYSAQHQFGKSRAIEYWFNNISLMNISRQLKRQDINSCLRQAVKRCTQLQRPKYMRGYHKGK